MASYLYGPVHSRRLGLSLGVDLLPPKTCTYDCLYCQIGRTESPTMRRKLYSPPEEVVGEVKSYLAENPSPDYITLGGSGEPTLHSGFGDIARDIKQISDVPICMISNGSLFHLSEVRDGCAPLDVILPSLDAPDAETFRRINRPHRDITFRHVVEGLERLSQEFTGEIWLEILFLEGINDSEAHIGAFRRLIGRIDPDRVQLNTAVRPAAHPDTRAVSPERLYEIQVELGPHAEVIASFADEPRETTREVEKERILDMLRRRPCTLGDISEGLGVNPHAVSKILGQLSERGKIETREKGDEVYYAPTASDVSTS
ncbi:MAG: radical SAM protein [Planctomycetota bacterium]